MRRVLLIALILPLALTACRRPGEGYGAARDHGRYEGIGVYPANQMWRQIVTSGEPAQPTAAKLQDDDQIIVVVDSSTGEIRQCGNLSGYCVGMNPWSRPLSGLQTAPLFVQKHATEVERETAAAADAAAATPSGAPPTDLAAKATIAPTKP